MSYEKDLEKKSLKFLAHGLNLQRILDLIRSYHKLKDKEAKKRAKHCIISELSFYYSKEKSFKLANELVGYEDGKN